MTVVGIDNGYSAGVCSNIIDAKDRIQEAISSLNISRTKLNHCKGESNRLATDYDTIGRIRNRLNNDLKSLNDFQSKFNTYIQNVIETDEYCEGIIKLNSKVYNKQNNISVVSQAIAISTTFLSDIAEVAKIVFAPQLAILDLCLNPKEAIKSIIDFYNNNQWFRGLVQIGLATIALVSAVALLITGPGLLLGIVAVASILFQLESIASGVITMKRGINKENKPDCDLAGEAIENYYSTKYEVGSAEYKNKVAKAKAFYEGTDIITGLAVPFGGFAKNSYKAFKPAMNPFHQIKPDIMIDILKMRSNPMSAYRVVAEVKLAKEAFILPHISKMRSNPVSAYRVIAEGQVAGKVEIVDRQLKLFEKGKIGIKIVDEKILAHKKAMKDYIDFLENSFQAGFSKPDTSTS